MESSQRSVRMRPHERLIVNNIMEEQDLRFDFRGASKKLTTHSFKKGLVLSSQDSQVGRRKLNFLSSMKFI